MTTAHPPMPHLAPSRVTPDPVYNERLRLCRELHDGAVQDILAALLSLRTMPRGEDGAGVPHRQAAIRALEQALRGMRSLIRSVRSAHKPVDVGTPMQQLASVIDRFVAPVARLGDIRLAVRVEADMALPLAQADEVGNILREVARNVVRHANATTLQVTASRGSNAIAIGLRDDGAGFATVDACDGLGTAGIVERAALIGGAVVISSCRGAGTLVRVIVPCAPGSLPRRLRPTANATAALAGNAFPARLVA